MKLINSTASCNIAALIDKYKLNLYSQAFHFWIGVKWDVENY